MAQSDDTTTSGTGPSPTTEPPADATPDHHGPSRHRHWWNWLSMLGLLIALLGFAFGLFLLLVEFRMPSASAYLSIITFGVVPSIIAGGIGIAVLGFVLQWLHVRWKGEETLLWFDPKKQKRWLPLYGAVVLIFLIVSTYGSYRSALFVESREFCGEVCHEVMHPEFIAHSNSPHARVACTQCHTGPGIEHHLRDKLRGMHQMIAVTTGNFERPIKTPLEHLRPAHEICEQCHWPEKFIGTIVQKHDYFLPDEENTRHQLALHVHVGGGDLDLLSDERPSIHWHVNSPSTVHYIATDDKRQDIVWVKLVDAHGRQVTYRKEGVDIPEAELVAKYEVREMDCIDCHNRSVHQFRPPQRLLNTALMAGTLDRSLPFIKREGLKLLKGEYEDHAAAEAEIMKQLTEFYRREYPDLWTEKESSIKSAAGNISNMFATNMFPIMKVDWRTHPDNIGHTFYEGCFRCHAGNLVSDQGLTISSSCDTCHEIVAQGVGDAPLQLASGLEFVHPEDIMDMWKEMRCTECHDGGGAAF